jgi:hypothetical protein
MVLHEPEQVVGDLSNAAPVGPFAWAPRECWSPSRAMRRHPVAFSHEVDAIENGVADLADAMLKDRVAELKAIRDQANADAARAEGAAERVGPSITPKALKTFAREARKRMRTETGGYRRDHLRALAQRVEVDKTEVRIMGSKTQLLRTLVAVCQAQKRRVLPCPVWYRSGAPDRIRTVISVFGTR